MSFASTFPIYLQTTIKVTKPVSPLENEEAAAPKTPADGDETEEAEVEEELKEPVTEEVEEVAFERLNKAEPIWVRDPKTVTKEEYEAFYKATSKDTVAPLTWTHFKSDTASGIGFKALIFVPSALPQDFWQKADKGVKNVRMMVKRSVWLGWFAFALPNTPLTMACRRAQGLYHRRSRGAVHPQLARFPQDSRRW